MQINPEEQLNAIERNSREWRSLTNYDRTLLQQLGTCLQSCLAIKSTKTFVHIVIHQRPQAFDMFEYVATHLFRQWYYKKCSFDFEQLNYLTIVGIFNRRISLTLQNDDDDIEHIDENLRHQNRVRELLFDNNNSELFDILMNMLSDISKNDTHFIEMILPWYESYIFFEHSYIDSKLDEKFLHFYHKIIQCLKSLEYERSLVLVENTQLIQTTIHHRFYLGLCTLAMGVHVNCDENECNQAKTLLEFYLSRYINFIHYFITKNLDKSFNNLVCLTGIITYLVNYTLIIDNTNNQQLLIDLFLIILEKNFHRNLSFNWSTYETILIDSVICYLIIYTYDNRLLIEKLIKINENSIQIFEYLIKQAKKYQNYRIEILSQLFLLILTNRTKTENLTEILFRTCINYIYMSLENVHSYHYKRIPMSIFFKCLIQIVKFDYIQHIIRKEYLNLFVNMIINYEKMNLSSNIIYRESTMITLNILWSLSFNDSIKKILKQMEDEFFEIIKKINTNTNEMIVKQITCGLLYNLDRLDLSKNLLTTEHNFGKTIGISYDPSDYKTVQMIQQELTQNGHRVWTTYDRMDDNFISSFISIMNKTKYLIVCLSDMYRLNNRCRTELLYATTSGHHVLSWKVQTITNNRDKDEQIRIRNIRTLLNRITPNDYEITQPSTTDSSYVHINIEECPSPTNISHYQRTKQINKLENWTNVEIIHWCQSINLPGFLKLLSNFDGQSLMKLYEFCKQNSTDTVLLLNNDLHKLCEQNHLPDIQISIHEFIRFQIELEKLLSAKTIEKLSSSSKLIIHKTRSKIRICSIV